MLYFVFYIFNLKMSPTIFPISETSLCVFFGYHIEKTIHHSIIALNQTLLENPFEGLIETVPAYTSLTIYYEPFRILDKSMTPFQWVKQFITNLYNQKTIKRIETKENVVQIPVCYDEEYGYDLKELAMHKGVTTQQIIHWHQQEIYDVYMLGFTPGFAYMGEVIPALAMPRKASPRPLVASGSVGIAGNQTGIYPLDTPGGWQIIGRTPLTLFDVNRANPFLLKAGDKVKFYSIDKKEFAHIHAENNVLRKNTNMDALDGDVIILKQGIFATLQDQGRMGFQSDGVPVSGAMDWRAYLYANLLLGNAPDAAVIECVMGGLKLSFQKPNQIALTGGGSATLDGNAIAFYTPIPVQKDAILEIKYAPNGLRTYLAVGGGWKGNPLMGSQSVYVKANLGSPLKNNQALFFQNAPISKRKWIDLPSEKVNHYVNPKIRIIAGQELHWLRPESIQKLYEQTFALTNQCDRMGYRLSGEVLKVYQEQDLPSTAVGKGTVQRTPNGQLIILMHDAQTIGGYPSIGQVAYIDLPILAQLKPHDKIQFEAIAFEYAAALYLEKQKMWYELFH